MMAYVDFSNDQKQTPKQNQVVEKEAAVSTVAISTPRERVGRVVKQILKWMNSGADHTVFFIHLVIMINYFSGIFTNHYADNAMMDRDNWMLLSGILVTLWFTARILRRITDDMRKIRRDDTAITNEEVSLLQQDPVLPVLLGYGRVIRWFVVILHLLAFLSFLFIFTCVFLLLPMLTFIGYEMREIQSLLESLLEVYFIVFPFIIYMVGCIENQTADTIYWVKWKFKYNNLCCRYRLFWDSILLLSSVIFFLTVVFDFLAFGDSSLLLFVFGLLMLPLPIFLFQKMKFCFSTLFFEK